MHKNLINSKMLLGCIWTVTFSSYFSGFFFYRLRYIHWNNWEKLSLPFTLEKWMFIKWTWMDNNKIVHAWEASQLPMWRTWYCLTGVIMCRVDCIYTLHDLENSFQDQHQNHFFVLLLLLPRILTKQIITEI